ncbi:hypothetical protein INR49_006343 [Caranx melampygus]|nr:hypothetical protein INR49_006343 [Caranx melampygus]
MSLETLQSRMSVNAVRKQSSDEEVRIGQNSHQVLEETAGKKSGETPTTPLSYLSCPAHPDLPGVKSTDMKYKSRLRSRISNLKDQKNPDLRRNVLCGNISPERIASMTAEEMASAELKQIREALTKESSGSISCPRFRPAALMSP